MLEHNRVIFSEVSSDQIVSNYYLLVLYMGGACSNTALTRTGVHEHLGNSIALEYTRVL